MKKLILTVIAFLSFGLYHQAMAQDSGEKNPNLKQGGKYIGHKKDGKMHGKGVYEWKNGDRFEGNFVDGRTGDEGGNHERP